MLLEAFHAFVTLHHGYAFLRLNSVDYGNTDNTYLTVMRDMSLRYLTVWNLFLQVAYFTGCTLEDILGDKLPLRSTWARLRERVFQALVFPAALLVTSGFWVIFLYDRSLVYPEYVDQYVPPHINHFMHTNISVFSFLELVLRPHHFRKRNRNLFLLLVFCTAYLALFIWTYTELGIWIYPLYQKLNWTERIFTSILLGYIVPVAYYLLAESVAFSVWGGRKDQKTYGEKR